MTISWIFLPFRPDPNSFEMDGSVHRFQMEMLNFWISLDFSSISSGEVPEHSYWRISPLFSFFFFFSLPRSLGLGRGVRCVCMSGYHVAIRSMQRRRTRKSFVHGQKDNVPNPALISIGSLQSAYYYSVPSVEGVTSRPDDPNSSSEAYSHMNSGCMCHSNIPYSPKGMDPL